MQTDVSYHSFNSLEENVKGWFRRAKKEQDFSHALQVRYIATQLAQKYGIDKAQIAAAALLHNISKTIPANHYLTVAEEYGIEILPEERKNPELLHQKISRILAVEEFNISDKEVLNAISCHTTLRKSASTLDKVIFLADKKAQKTQPLFMPLIEKQEDNLNSAVYCYLFNLIQDKKRVQTIHPWTLEALEDLQQFNS